MEPSDQQLLIERIGRTLLFFCGIAAVVWFLPDWVRAYRLPAPKTTKESQEAHFDLASVLLQLSDQPIHKEVVGKVQFLRYQFENPQRQAQQLRDYLNEQYIENYHIVIDDTDHEIYIYVLGILHTRILLIQQRIAPEPPENTTPMIAIVIGGLGYQNTKDITEHPAPLTLAFSPLAPFSLSLAENSAQNWHEIVVDTRGLDIVQPENTIPFASGALSKKTSEIHRANLSSLYPGFQQTKKPLALLTKKHLNIPSLIIQSKQQSIQNGFSGILIEHDDPELPLVLEWSKKAKEEGFLIVMASELRYRNVHHKQDSQVPAMHE